MNRKNSNFVRKKIKNLLARNISSYDPIAYWASRVDPNNTTGKDPKRIAFDIKYISENLQEINYVFELGPGVGRTFGSYPPNCDVKTLDISKKYSNMLEEKSKDLRIKLEQHYLEQPLDQFPFCNREFKFGVAFQVFIHQPPDIFRHQFAEMCRICEKFVISCGISDNTNRSQKINANHVFSHDYIYEASVRNKILQNVIVADKILYMTICNNETYKI